MNLKNTFGAAAAATGSGLSKTPRDQRNNEESMQELRLL